MHISSGVYGSGRIMVKVGIVDLYFISPSFGLYVCAVLCDVHALPVYFLLFSLKISNAIIEFTLFRNTQTYFYAQK